jgi:hypothetical protein
MAHFLLKIPFLFLQKKVFHYLYPTNNSKVFECFVHDAFREGKRFHSKSVVSHWFCLVFLLRVMSNFQTQPKVWHFIGTDRTWFQRNGSSNFLLVGKWSKKNDIHESQRQMMLPDCFWGMMTWYRNGNTLSCNVTES